MKHPQQRLFRIALWLHKAYVRRAQVNFSNPSAEFRIRLPHQVDITRRRADLLTLATARGWERAAASLHAQYGVALHGLSEAVQQLCADYRQPQTATPAANDLYHELAAVRDDFGDVIVRGGTLAVLTDPIQLDDVRLGAFRIALDPDRLVHEDPERWYHIIAEDPQPSRPDDEVTHPHVSGDRLCAGEAAAAIRASLLDGRLSEFFLLVRSVLETYNPGSAYVKLSAWEGIPCADCGEYVDEDSLCFCEGCDRDYCDNCVRSCTDCGAVGCRECLSCSELSDDWVCSDCLTRCDGCGSTAANSELNDELLCPDCHEANEPELLEENDHDQTDHTQAGDQAEAPVTPTT